MRQKKSSLFSVTMVIAACAAFTLSYHYGFSGNASVPTKKGDPATDTAGSNSSPAESAVDLSPDQLDAVKIETVEARSFLIEKEALGSVAYHERNVSVDTQPDSASAPDKSARFIVANVSESDSPFIRVGQPVEAKMVVYPGRTFKGKVSALGVTVYDSGGNPAIDPNTHRIAVRCEIADPKNELYPGMLATIVIQVDKPVQSAAIPANGVMRKGDGTMTAWVTSDRKHFEERTIKVGLQQDGYDQITDGLKPGELVVTDGALFIDNALTAASQ